MDKLKKVSPIIIGVVIAAAGVLVALGMGKVEVKDSIPTTAGDTFEVKAVEDGILILTDFEVTIEGKTYESGDWWLMRGVDVYKDGEKIMPEKPEAPEDKPEEPVEDTAEQVEDQEPTDSEPTEPEAEEAEEEAAEQPEDQEPTEDKLEEPEPSGDGDLPSNGKVSRKRKSKAPPDAPLGAAGLPPMQLAYLLPTGAMGGLAAWVTEAMAAIGPQDLERVITIHRLWGSLPPNISYALAHLQRLIRSSYQQKDPPWLKIMQDMEKLASS